MTTATGWGGNVCKVCGCERTDSQSLPERHCCEMVPYCITRSSRWLGERAGRKQWLIRAREYAPIVQGRLWVPADGSKAAAQALRELVDVWGDLTGADYNAKTKTWFLFSDDTARFKPTARRWPADATEPPLEGDLAAVVQGFWDIGWTCVDDD